MDSNAIRCCYLTYLVKSATQFRLLVNSRQTLACEMHMGLHMEHFSSQKAYISHLDSLLLNLELHLKESTSNLFFFKTRVTLGLILEFAIGTSSTY